MYYFEIPQRHNWLFLCVYLDVSVIGNHLAISVFLYKTTTSNHVAFVIQCFYTINLCLVLPDFKSFYSCLLRLTLSCLEISLKRIVCILETFENNFGVNHKFTKYLKEGCGLNLDQHSSCKYFLQIALFVEVSLLEKNRLDLRYFRK